MSYGKPRATYIQGASGEKVNILGGHSIGYSKQKLYMYMCPIPNDFQDRAIDIIARIKEPQDAVRRATRHDLTRVAKCIDVGGRNFENVLYQVNCTNFIT
jgi:hypothetical protein